MEMSLSTSTIWKTAPKATEPTIRTLRAALTSTELSSIHRLALSTNVSSCGSSTSGRRRDWVQRWVRGFSGEGHMAGSLSCRVAVAARSVRAREGGRAPACCPGRSHRRMTRASGAYRLVDRPSAPRRRGASRRVVARPSRRMPGWGAARTRRERRGWIAREASGRPARWRKHSARKRRAWHSRPKSLSRRARPRPSVSWIAALQQKICWKRVARGPLARNSEPSDWLKNSNQAHQQRARRICHFQR